MPQKLTSAALALLIAMPASSALAAPVTFNFLFAPTAGTGFMTFDDPGDGTHNFFGLTNVSALFDFGTFSFTMADLDTASGAVVVIETEGGTRTLVFSGDGDGFFTGSLDFQRGSAELSFGPTSFEGEHYIRDGAFSEFGNYSATAPAVSAIPLPASLPLLAAGLALLRRRASA